MSNEYFKETPEKYFQVNRCKKKQFLSDTRTDKDGEKRKSVKLISTKGIIKETALISFLLKFINILLINSLLMKVITKHVSLSKHDHKNRTDFF